MAAIINALKFIPASLGVKMLKKFNPKFKSFFTDAAAYGYDIDRAVGYIADRFGGQSQGDQQNLRPDEMAAQQQVRSAQQPGRIARTLASFGAAGLLTPSEEEQPQAPTQAPSDIFLKKHPELGMFLEKKINEGIAPPEAAKRAKGIAELKSAIGDLERNIGQPLEDIVSQVFGAPQATSQSQGNITQDIAQLKALMQQWAAMRGQR